MKVSPKLFLNCSLKIDVNIKKLKFGKLAILPCFTALESYSRKIEFDSISLE